MHDQVVSCEASKRGLISSSREADVAEDSQERYSTVQFQGDSMRPTIEPGDMLQIDRSINHYRGEGIYLFRVGDQVFTKILQNIPGEGLVAISANKHYVAWTVTPDMDFEVFGRVVQSWHATRC